MMQQPVCPQDQIGNQQPLTQQMVLCPVKLVYDTQILVQPGDQIQPNQTLYINPQNPPPWIQNRIQNQVVYVHQVANNYYQPQIDPSSVYINNYPYQIQQQIFTQNPQEQRPVQITSLAPNIIQSLPNVHHTNNMPNTVRNVNHPQTNFSQMPQQNLPNRQLTPNIGLNQVQIPQQITIQRPYMNIRPQVAVNPNIRQPIISDQNIPNIRQTLTPTINQQRPIQIKNPTNVQRMIQPYANPTAQVQTVGKVLEPTLPNNQNKPKYVSTNASNLKSPPNFTYRPIQPRPQYRPNVSNIGVMTQTVAQMPNIPNNYTRPKVNPVNIINTVAPVNLPNVGNTNETQGNRKRKSESPDAIQKKLLIINSTVTNNVQNQNNVPLINMTMPNEISITRTDNNVSNQNTVQLLNNGAKIVKLVDNGQQTSLNETPLTTTDNTNQINPNDKEKLVRNTVFPQARGRLLNDKEIVPNNVNNTHDSKSQEIPEEAVNKKEMCDIIKTEETVVIDKNNFGTLKNQQYELNKSGIKSDNKLQIREMQWKDEMACEQQILTHVLDGYVIQESNMAFPIRKPLREKIVYENIKGKSFVKELKKDEIDKIDEKSVNNQTDLPQIPFQKLQLDGEKSDDTKEINKKGPFSMIQPPAIVKSWTVDHLAKHLTEHGWKETVSILQEHEIDGESLFLASKNQLVHIGISEEHADVICEFIKQ